MLAGKVVVFLTICFLSLGELEQVTAAPLTFRAQFTAALQQVAELKKDCCDVHNVSHMILIIHVNITANFQ